MATRLTVNVGIGLLVFASVYIAHVELGVGHLYSLMISAAMVSAVVFSANTRIRVFRGVYIDLGGFVAPLLCSFEVVILALMTYGLWILYRALYILVLLVLIHTPLSLYVRGEGVRVDVVASSLITAALVMLAYSETPGLQAPLSLALGALSVAVAADLIKASALARSYSAEFVLGGAGLRDAIIVTGSLSALVSEAARVLALCLA